MQGYTQYGGLRPFGVSLLYAGWDAENKYQLYQSDPSGNYGGWKATAIGANQQVLPYSLPPSDLCRGLTCPPISTTDRTIAKRLWKGISL